MLYVVCHAGDRSRIGAPDAMEQMRTMAWRMIEDGAKTGRWHKRIIPSRDLVFHT